MKVSGQFNLRDGLPFVERELVFYTRDGISMVENMGYHFFVVADKLLDIMNTEEDFGKLKKMEDGIDEMIVDAFNKVDEQRKKIIAIVEDPGSKIVSGRKYKDSVKVFSGELGRLLDVLEMYDRAIFVAEAGYLVKKLSMSQKRMAVHTLKKDVYRLHDELSKFVSGVQKIRAQ